MPRREGLFNMEYATLSGPVAKEEERLAAAARNSVEVKGEQKRNQTIRGGDKLKTGYIKINNRLYEEEQIEAWMFKKERGVFQRMVDPNLVRVEVKQRERKLKVLKRIGPVRQK